MSANICAINGDSAGRVLALDGGGVKGLVQLQILEHLLDKIGLRETVHISSFFDLLVGSSIGNEILYYTARLQRPLPDRV